MAGRAGEKSHRLVIDSSEIMTSFNVFSQFILRLFQVLLKVHVKHGSP